MSHGAQRQPARRRRSPRRRLAAMSVIAERSTGALDAAGPLFTALGWTMLGLDAACNIQYCSSPIADLLDDELRQLLQQGEVREGWRTVLRGTDGATRQVSVAAAPCNVDGIRYVVVLRPADDALLLGDAAPTFFFGVVARSPAMLDIVALLDAVRATNVPLILTGEEGTGKKTLARALHAASPRRAGRFVAIDCAVLPPELLSFDVPRDGTLFLNHVERMPLELQAKLLPILEESGARIVAATNSEIRRSAEAGTFRDALARPLRPLPRPAALSPQPHRPRQRPGGGDGDGARDGGGAERNDRARRSAERRGPPLRRCPLPHRRARRVANDPRRPRHASLEPRGHRTLAGDVADDALAEDARAAAGVIIAHASIRRCTAAPLRRLRVIDAVHCSGRSRRNTDRFVHVERRSRLPIR